MKRKPIFILVGVVLFFLGIILSITYRPYIYQNNLNDYHLADTIGSLFCVPAATFLFCGISKRKTFNELILITLVGNIFYECLGIFNIQGVFDFFDIIAIITGTLITYFIGKWFKIEKQVFIS
ncbi:MAG: hypothetical protein ACK5KP_09710 [Paludibacteraceae bacterium]